MWKGEKFPQTMFQKVSTGRQRFVWTSSLYVGIKQGHNCLECYHKDQSKKDYTIVQIPSAQQRETSLQWSVRFPFFHRSHLFNFHYQ